jgi:hypothetical protein
MNNFGARLREARERKGIPLRQIADSTKISLATLQSLERNEISRLPGGIFSRGFVRSYAVEVGLDPDEMVKAFLEQCDVEGPATAVADRVGPRGARLGGAGIDPGSTDRAASSSDDADFESRQRTAAIVLTLALVSLSVVGAIAYFTSRSPAPPSTQATPRDSSEKTETTEPAALASATAPRVATTEPAPAPGPDVVTLEIAPIGACWVKLTADGELAVSRELSPGERETHTFRDQAILQLGDAAACALSINGHPAEPLGTSGQVRVITLTRENYRSFLR